MPPCRESGTRRSKTPALILLVALHNVAATDRSRTVFLALQVAVDPVVPDLHAARVLEGLEVAADDVAVRPEGPILLVEQDVPVDPIPKDPRRAALPDLNASSDTGALSDDHVARVLGLHVTDHPDAEGTQGRAPPP
jgi:hypothetical protein